MSKPSTVVLIIFFLLILIFVPVMTFAQKGEEFSVFENRALEEIPQFDREQFLSGGYFSRWDTYLSDHLYLRDEMLTLYTKVNMNLLGKTMVNDVIVQDDLLLPYNRRYSISYETYRANIENTAQVIGRVSDYVSEMGGAFLFVGIPEQGSIFRNQHPAGSYNLDAYLTYIERTMFDFLDEYQVPYLNMTAEFQKEDDYGRYYSTIDHHYNYFGALKTYHSIMEYLNSEAGMDLKTYGENDLIIEPYDGVFHGSRSIKLYNQYKSDEKLYVGHPVVNVPFTRVDNDKTEYDTLFHKPFYTGDYVFYTLYMGGDVGKTVISTDRPELPTVLMWGDSFTNALETLMYLSFDKAVYLDFRHNRTRDIYSYLDEYEPDVVIYVSNDTSYGARHENILSIESS